uniref:Uncharacterized protein TCIL3000_11_8460 n=1 Tax=Trypanosoma congolense (strain IL3000) TaxID=1068625 RepID=G0V171_TRYCI|nr:unnamed protein product [Trypanosoma congolense IL3000]
MIRSCRNPFCGGGPALFRGQLRWRVDTKGLYKRHSSNPQTVRERGNFQRDMKFSKQRPLPTVPWLQDKRRTYLDDAERLYGRKEDWYRIEDEAVREKLVSLLQDYLKDTTEAALLEVRSARKYKRLCEQMDSEFRTCIVTAASSSPALLRAQVLASAANAVHDSSPMTPMRHHRPTQSEAARGLSNAGEDDDGFSGDNREVTSGTQEQISKRRTLKVVEGHLENTPAMMDLSKQDERARPYSAFPFLRQRAIENGESLDPSLVDWTAKYFPDDDKRTFSSPPKLREVTEKGCEQGDSSMGSSDAQKPRERVSSVGFKLTARHRLRRSLRVHEDLNRPTFDAEGVFYRVRKQGSEDDRAPKPRPARGSDTCRNRDRDVVKVPWDTVSKAKEMGYTVDVLRAKERLIRLTRGEHPGTVP